MNGASTRVLLGHIAGAHGIRGEVLIKTYTAEPEAIGQYGPLSDETGAHQHRVTVVRVTSKGVIARIAGVSDRNGAERLKGSALYAARELFAPSAEGEYYYADLIGLTVIDPEGRAIGTVVAVQNFGAGDLLEIKLGGARHTELLPFTDAFVPTVDIAAGRVTVLMPTAEEE